MEGERSSVWHQKFGLALIVTIAIATFVLGFVRIKTTIANTMKRTGQVAFKSDEQLQSERDAKLKAVDTDNDGLNDYDELYIFRTSPYLDDSDSDGTLDGAEISANTDPNCPAGRQCRQTSATPDAAVTAGSGAAAAADAVAPGQGASTGSAAPDKALQAILDTFGDPTKMDAARISSTLEAMSSEELRGFITALGVPESALAKADDATLRKMLADTLIEIAAASSASASTSGGATP